MDHPMRQYICYHHRFQTQMKLNFLQPVETTTKYPSMLLKLQPLPILNIPLPKKQSINPKAALGTKEKYLTPIAAAAPTTTIDNPTIRQT